MRSDPHPSATTGWQTIRDEALRRIHAREWPQGALIPNEADLAEEFGCARTTVNRALRALAEEGFLERRRKGGTRVVTTPLRKVTLQIPVIRQEVEASGGQYGYRLISHEMQSPPSELRSRLALSEDTALLHVRALHLRDAVPHVYEDRWLNPAAVPEILQVDLTAISANEWLVRNVPYSEGVLTLSALNADEDMAACLDCAVGTALFTMERITWKNDAPVTLVTQHYAPGHRLSTTI